MRQAQDLDRRTGQGVGTDGFAPAMAGLAQQASKIPG
jgi:hypothetical protein